MADIEVSPDVETPHAFSHRLVHEVFEQRAAEAPGAVAVEGANESLTYAALNERANSLARLLQERGAEPETIVGLYLARGVDFVVAQMASLKAGAAYLPLDVADPPSRTEEILAVAGASFVVTPARWKPISCSGITRHSFCCRSVTMAAACSTAPPTAPASIT